METASSEVIHPWWQPGVFASAPAIFLWVCAELPPDMLGAIFHAGTSPDSLMHVGDTLFVIGWTASGVLMWHGRRRVGHDTDVAPQASLTAAPADETAPQAHGLSALRQSVARRWERMRHPMALH
ncbi:MAG: hypothetical protein KGJ38_11810 [Burkholderiaceae bacterium]|nr:hypothetical protein [Burkholderiaceae bacterium]